MSVLSIKVPIRKKSGNLSYAPRMSVYIYSSIYLSLFNQSTYIYIYIYIFFF